MKIVQNFLVIPTKTYSMGRRTCPQSSVSWFIHLASLAADSELFNMATEATTVYIYIHPSVCQKLWRWTSESIYALRSCYQGKRLENSPVICICIYISTYSIWLSTKELVLLLHRSHEPPVDRSLHIQENAGRALINMNNCTLINPGPSISATCWWICTFAIVMHALCCRGRNCNKWCQRPIT